ncbi:hypothetical protein [Alteromonas flava]|uniref:hypothetical protein n=1 Tax=Alteromonas flava TaxID=2048003 RepID=UPI000C29051C|nr:hypothetical protein [Alteromonas flava]
MVRFNLQDIASFVAVLVAVVALYVGWDQSRIIRNQQHADVYPVVEIKSQFVTKTLDDGKQYRMLQLDLLNAGVGPAFIESAKWKIGDNTIKHTADLANALPQNLSPAAEYQGSVSGFVLAPGNSENVWQVAFPLDEQSKALTDVFMQDFWAMDLEVCYCSLYERCWVSDYNAATPRPREVAACKG